MSNDLAKIQSSALSPAEERQSWELMREQASMLIKTRFLPDAIQTPEQAVMVMMKGRELGIPSLYALSNIVVIKGKPACSAELLQALIYRDHGDDALRFTESTNDACTIEYRRRSWKKPERYTFTIQDATRANLNSQTWKQYPAAMLRARCISAVARMAFADSIGGMHTSEELGASVRVVDGVVELDPASVIDVTPNVPQTAQIAPERTEAADVVVEDDAITGDAIDAITALRDKRGLTVEDMYALLWWKFRANSMNDLTVEQGRDLYRFLNRKNTSDSELTVELDKARREDAERHEFDTGDLPPDDTDSHNDSDPVSRNADLIEGFGGGSTNPMFT